MNMRKSIKMSLLAVAGVSVAGCTFFGKKQQKSVETDIVDVSSPMVSSASDSILSKKEMITDEVVETIPPSIEKKNIIDKVEDDDAVDERFAGASAKDATQVMDITENKKIEGPQKQKEEPKAEIIRVVDDDSGAGIRVEGDYDPDIKEIINSWDSVEWVDLEEYEIVEVEAEPEEEEVFLVVEDAPEFPGGTQALLDFLKKNVKYPAICRDNNIQGRVIVSFVVDKDGSIVEQQVEKGVHPKLDEEALRIISIMPKWKPGYNRGKPVRVKYSVPVTFRLN